MVVVVVVLGDCVFVPLPQHPSGSHKSEAPKLWVQFQGVRIYADQHEVLDGTR